MSSLVSRINQVRYDSEKSLLNLRDNAINNDRFDIIDAVNQRLKKRHPKIYERIVGPLHKRQRDRGFKCYCNHPKSLYSIYKDILGNKVHAHSLMCDACWQEDIAKTWGYYGWTSNLIPQKTWDALCESRAYYKFVD